ncbi:MAG: hypothetical protein ACYC4E_02230 [Carboxydocellales bacterium]
MLYLFAIFAGLALLFGYAVSAYYTFYRFRFRGVLTRLLAFLVNGFVVSLATFALAVSIIWPPVM